MWRQLGVEGSSLYSSGLASIGCKIRICVLGHLHVPKRDKSFRMPKGKCIGTVSSSSWRCITRHQNHQCKMHTKLRKKIEVLVSLCPRVHFWTANWRLLKIRWIQKYISKASNISRRHGQLKWFLQFYSRCRYVLSNCWSTPTPFRCSSMLSEVMDVSVLRLQVSFFRVNPDAQLVSSSQPSLGNLSGLRLCECSWVLFIIFLFIPLIRWSPFLPLSNGNVISLNERHRFRLLFCLISFLISTTSCCKKKIGIPNYQILYWCDARPWTIMCSLLGTPPPLVSLHPKRRNVDWFLSHDDGCCGVDILGHGNHIAACVVRATDREQMPPESFAESLTNCFPRFSTRSTQPNANLGGFGPSPWSTYPKRWV